jgi:RNA-directed DNA polymerase
MTRPSLVCTLAAISDVRNLLNAATTARRHKRLRPDVETWWQRRESEVLRLHGALSAGTWQPADYRFFEIHDPKRRTIAAAPFADRVVHHAVCHPLAPVLERRFIARSFSCQIGKGTTAARDCCRKLVNTHRYVLKCDVRKFFPSLGHGVLMAKLSQHLSCPGALDLCQRLVDSHRTPGAARPCGLPIGNLTSQLWGNFYLDAMDHLITETHQHGAYLRYTDDFLLFGNDKLRLWALRSVIVEHLASINLQLAEPKSRLLTTHEGVPFCGFLFRPGVQPRVLGATKRRFEQRLYRQRAGQEDTRRIRQGVFAWYQFSKEGNTQGLRRAYAGWPAQKHQRHSKKIFRASRPAFDAKSRLVEGKKEKGKKA